jgi:hypothetical protein
VGKLKVSWLEQLSTVSVALVQLCRSALAASVLGHDTRALTTKLFFLTGCLGHERGGLGWPVVLHVQYVVLDLCRAVEVAESVGNMPGRLPSRLRCSTLRGTMMEGVSWCAYDFVGETASPLSSTAADAPSGYEDVAGGRRRFPSSRTSTSSLSGWSLTTAPIHLPAHVFAVYDSHKSATRSPSATTARTGSTSVRALLGATRCGGLRRAKPALETSL